MSSDAPDRRVRAGLFMSPQCQCAGSRPIGWHSFIQVENYSGLDDSAFLTFFRNLSMSDPPHPLPTHLLIVVASSETARPNSKRKIQGRPMKSCDVSSSPYLIFLVIDVLTARRVPLAIHLLTEITSRALGR
jgi:hypothetical protein